MSILVGNVVFRDNCLRRIVPCLLPEINSSSYAVHNGNKEMKTRLQLSAELAEAFNNDCCTLADNNNISQSKNDDNYDANDPPDNGPAEE